MNRVFYSIFFAPNVQSKSQNWLSVIKILCIRILPYVWGNEKILSDHEWSILNTETLILIIDRKQYHTLWENDISTSSSLSANDAYSVCIIQLPHKIYYLRSAEHTKRNSKTSSKATPFVDRLRCSSDHAVSPFPTQAVTYRLEKQEGQKLGFLPPSFFHKQTGSGIPSTSKSWVLAAGKAHFTKLSDAELWWPGRTDARTQPTKGKTRERLDKWYRPAGSICDIVRKKYTFSSCEWRLKLVWRTGRGEKDFDTPTI